ncbi:MAG: galactose mutarotase [Cyclobacteriaceae bacterium]|nr:galactose mutarotase [Cyclobacteriaceae bacterium]
MTTSKVKYLFLCLSIIGLWNCQPKKNMDTAIRSSVYGKLNGKEIIAYTLQNKSGMQVIVLNYGTTITKMSVPDQQGVLENVVLGFDSLEGYLQENNPYFGPTIGRFANRIGKARFTLNDTLYNLTANNNGNTLHGGESGLHKRIWDTKILSDSSIQFTYLSPDGEEGFPGNLQTEVIMTLKSDNALQIDYTATTDRATPVSLTNHAYFNLSYGSSETILDHDLMIQANEITPVDSLLIPTGILSPVINTAFDFNQFKTIGRDISQVAGGYDHNFVLKKETGKLELAATVVDRKSGRKLELFTTEPGLQFYSGNFLDGTLKGTNGIMYKQHAGFCLEPQRFPDSPNQISFPNCILQPGETYKQTSVYKFSVQ